MAQGHPVAPNARSESPAEVDNDEIDRDVEFERSRARIAAEEPDLVETSQLDKSPFVGESNDVVVGTTALGQKPARTGVLQVQG